MNNNYKFSKDINYYLNKNNEICHNCSCKFKKKSILKKSSRIIVIGDVHGDFDSFKISLLKANIIDENDNWIGNNTKVVQLGDILDKGGRGIETNNLYEELDELKILDYITFLNKKAKKTNGRIYTLIGNHELMNVLGDFRYVSKQHLDGFNGIDNRKLLFKPGGILARKLACNSRGILQIGSWIFCHTGLLPKHFESIKKKKKIEEINNTIKDVLLGKLKMKDIDRNLEDIIFGSDSFLWNRYYSDENNDIELCSTLNNTLNILNIKNNGGMVLGHTPQKNITSKCNKKLWFADTMMSSGFKKKENKKDRIEVLEIINDGEKINIIN